MGGVGVEVLLRQTHGVEILARGAVHEDGIGRRQVIRGDVVRQDGQRAHAFQPPLPGHVALPIGRPPDIGALRAPLVEGAHLRSDTLVQVEHGNVGFTELLRLHRRLDDGIDFAVFRPDILESDRIALGVVTQHVLLDIETDGARNGIGHHQRRRGQKRLFGVRVDTPIEVAVTRQHRRGIEIATNDLLLDTRLQCAGHAVAGGAGVCHDAEAQRFQLAHQLGFFQVHLDRLRPRSQRGLDPRFAGQAKAVGVSGNQACRHHVARVGGIGAASDGRNDHRSIGHPAGGLLFPSLVQPDGNAALGKLRGGQVGMGVGRPRQGTRHAGQVKAQDALVDNLLQVIGPEPGMLGVGLHQGYLLIVTAGQLEVVDGLVVDIEHRRRGTVLRGHVGDGCPISHRQRVGTFPEELQIGADHALAAQELGNCQHHVGASDTGLQLTRQLDTHDIGQAHHGGAPQHHALGFQPPDPHGDHAQRVHHGRVAVGAHAGVRVGHLHALLIRAALHHRRHLFQVDLVHDAVAGRNHVDVLERQLGPVDEVKAVVVTPIFHLAILLEGVLLETGVLHGQRMVDDQLRRHHRVHLGRVTALLRDGVAQPGQVDQRGLAQDVVTHHPGRVPGKVQLLLALDQLFEGVGQQRRITAPNQLLGQHPRRIGQLGIGTGLNLLDGLACIEKVHWCARHRHIRQRFAIIRVHDASHLVTEPNA